MMRFVRILLLVGLFFPLTSSAGQTSVRLGLGGVGATKLIGDRVNPFDEVYGVNLTQRKGPAVQLSVAFKATPGYRVRLQGELASTTVDVHDEDTGDVNEFGTMKMFTAFALVEGQVVPHLNWQAGVGKVMYLPSEKIGLFQDGGPTRWAVAAGLSRVIALTTKTDIVLSAQYSYHQFITTTLKNRDFNQSQAVHRVGVSLSLERLF